MLLLCIVLFANTVVRYFFVPKYWGHRIFAEKIRYLEEYGHKYNFVFIGNSRVFRQIDPAVFTPIVASEWPDVSAYNLGIPTFSLLEEYYVLRHLLNEDILKPKVLVLQIESSYNWHKERKRNTPWAYHWASIDMFPSAFSLLLDYHYQHSLPGALLELTENHVKYASNVNMLRKSVLRRSDKIQISQSGFSSTDSVRDKMRSFAFKNSLEAYIQQIQNIRKLQQSTCKKIPTHQLQLLQKIFHLAEQNNMYLIVVNIPPQARWKSQCLLQALPQKHVIHYPHVAEYPHMYQKENFFDATHFNGSGAVLYTEYLAHKFLKLLSTTPDLERVIEPTN